METCFSKIYKFPSVRYLGSKEFLLTESEGRWLVRQLIPKSVASTGITELRGDYTGEGWPEHATRKWSLRYTTGPEIDVSWMPEDQYTHRYFREFRIQFLEMMVTNIFRKWFTRDITERYYSLKLASVWNIGEFIMFLLTSFVFVRKWLIVGIFGIFLGFCKNG